MSEKSKDIKSKLNKLRNSLKISSWGSGTPISEPKQSEYDEKSNLKNRLAQLKNERKVQSKTYAGVRISNEELSKLLKGEIVADGLIKVDTIYEPVYKHGETVLSQLLNQNELSWSEAAGIPIDKLLFFDTETTGLSGGSGTIVFLLGMARIENNVFKVRQYFLTAYKGEAKLLKESLKWLNNAQCLISYNGKCFDSPLLQTRFKLSSINSNLNNSKHFDLLYPVRRAFTGIWENCRLQTAEKNLIQFHRKDDVPGSEIPECWFNFIRSGTVSKIPQILTHNKFDLVSLLVLMFLLKKIFIKPGINNSNTASIAKYYINVGKSEYAKHYLEMNKEKNGNAELLLLSNIYRKQKQWDHAVFIWEKLSKNNCFESLERLAKYHEHIVHDYKKAKSYTEKLLELHPENDLYIKRLNRLKKRILKNSREQVKIR